MNLVANDCLCIIYIRLKLIKSPVYVELSILKSCQRCGVTISLISSKSTVLQEFIKNSVNSSSFGAKILSAYHVKCLIVSLSYSMREGCIFLFRLIKLKYLNFCIHPTDKHISVYIKR